MVDAFGSDPLLQLKYIILDIKVGGGVRDGPGPPGVILVSLVLKYL